MNTFIYGGRDASGTSRHERVSAENAQEAKSMLIAQGWSELRLVTDEICDNAVQSVRKPEYLKEADIQIDADGEVNFFEGRGPGFWSQYRKSMLKAKGSLLLGALIIGLGVYNHHKWPLVIGGLWLGFLIVVFPLIHFFFSMPLHYYNRLNQAKVWSRWDEVLLCVNRLQQMHRLTRIGAGEVELTRCRVQVLAAKGQLDEGLKVFAIFGNGSKIPQWNYFSFVAGICDIAKEYRRALDYRRRAVEEKPDSSALWIDLAYGYVRGLDDPAEARKALKRIDTLEVSAMGVPYLSFVRGIICWREEKFAEARSFFEEAIPGFKPYAHNPLVEGVILLNKSYLCAVCGELGDLDTARRYFRETETFLQSGKEKELLEKCRNALAVKS